MTSIKDADLHSRAQNIQTEITNFAVAISKLARVMAEAAEAAERRKQATQNAVMEHLFRNKVEIDRSQKANRERQQDQHWTFW